MVFEGDCAGVVGNVEGQDDAEAVDVKDRLTVHIGRPEAKARNYDIMVVQMAPWQSQMPDP